MSWLLVGAIVIVNIHLAWLGYRVCKLESEARQLRREGHTHPFIGTRDGS